MAVGLCFGVVLEQVVVGQALVTPSPVFSANLEAATLSTLITIQNDTETDFGGMQKTAHSWWKNQRAVTRFFWGQQEKEDGSHRIIRSRLGKLDDSQHTFCPCSSQHAIAAEAAGGYVRIEILDLIFRQTVNVCGPGDAMHR